MKQLVSAPLLAFTIALVLGPILLPLLRRLRFGQVVRADGPQTHLRKSGTPTMGGVLFILGAVAAVLVFAPPTGQVYLYVATMIGSGLIGFADDYIKVVLRRPLGLRAREKLLAQVALGLLLGLVSVLVLHVPTTIRIPFTHLTLDFGWAYIPFVVFFLTAMANGTNLTDGVDGLCGSVTIIGLIVYVLIGLAAGRTDLAIAAAGLAGGIGGFLCHNWHPAKVIMGDTGSNALGGALTALAVLTKTEIVLAIVGGVYVIETVSDIIQVVWFRKTGRRVFRMAPLHHHFELSGWSEQKVVLRFCLVAVVCGLLGFLAIGGIGE